MWHSSSCLWLSKSKIVVYANVIMYLDLVFSGERVGKRDHKRKVVRMLINQLRAQLLPIISSYFGWWQLDDFKVPGRFVDAPPSPPQSKRPRKLKASDWGKTFKSKYLYNLVYFENVLLRFRRTTLYFFFFFFLKSYLKWGSDDLCIFNSDDMLSKHLPGYQIRTLGFISRSIKKLHLFLTIHSVSLSLSCVCVIFGSISQYWAEDWYGCCAPLPPSLVFFFFLKS